MIVGNHQVYAAVCVSILKIGNSECRVGPDSTCNLLLVPRTPYREHSSVNLACSRVPRNPPLQYRSPQFAFYDLLPLCQGAYYNWTDDGFPNNGVSIIFQICGLSNTVCVPTYTVPFNRATAIQFLDYDGVGNCTNTDGVQVPCTGNCEILGEGPPIFSVLDPIGDPFGGVSVRHAARSSGSDMLLPCPP